VESGRIVEGGGMNRRGFLRAFVTAAVGAAIAPGVVPIDRTSELMGFKEAINDGVCAKFDREVWQRTIRDTFFRPTPLWLNFKDGQKKIP
jgi:hypothetical protein